MSGMTWDNTNTKPKRQFEHCDHDWENIDEDLDICFLCEAKRIPPDSGAPELEESER